MFNRSRLQHGVMVGVLTQGRVPPLADGENGVRKGRASPGCTTVSGEVGLGLMTSVTFSSPLPT